MSIALDTALYLREVQLDKPLTLTERGALFTLMFRVGSNPFAWVSQQTLAIELDIQIRNVRNVMNNLAIKGYIEIQKCQTDHRKNLYRPAGFLINYHQNAKREITKEYRSKSSGTTRDTGRNHPLDTGRNHPLSEGEKIPAAQQPRAITAVPTSPKGNINNNILKQKEPLPGWLPQETWNQFVQHRKEIKKPLNAQSEKMALKKLALLKSEGHDPVDVIGESIMNGWAGLFELKKKNPVYPQFDKKSSTNSTYAHLKFVDEEKRESHGSEISRDHARGNSVRTAASFVLPK